MEPWTIYQNHLRDLHCGLPLWDPTPKKSIEIIAGSVLYPGSDGTFSLLFNARKGPDDTHWQPNGVPEGFRTLDEEFGPLTIDGPRHVHGLSGFNCRSVECTKEVSGDVGFEVAAGAGPTVSAGGGFKLTCKNESGALLALAHDPLAVHIESSARITSYMARHHASWLDMANSQSASGLGLGVELEDLYFVSGTMKVPQWFIGVFDGGDESERGGRLECTVANVFDLNAQVSEIRTVHRSPILKKGPVTVLAETELSWNQCIFIRYFKMRRRIFRAPKVIKAAAGPHVLLGGEPDKESPPPILARAYGDNDWEVDIEQGLGRSKIIDPVDNLLDYILSHSRADLAIASDADLQMLFDQQDHMTAGTSGLDPNRVVVVVDEHGIGRIYPLPANPRQNRTALLTTSTPREACATSPIPSSSPEPQANLSPYVAGPSLTPREACSPSPIPSSSPEPQANLSPYVAGPSLTPREACSTSAIPPSSPEPQVNLSQYLAGPILKWNVRCTDLNTSFRATHGLDRSAFTPERKSCILRFSVDETDGWTVNVPPHSDGSMLSTWDVLWAIRSSLFAELEASALIPGDGRYCDAVDERPGRLYGQEDARTNVFRNVDFYPEATHSYFHGLIEEAPGQFVVIMGPTPKP